MGKINVCDSHLRSVGGPDVPIELLLAHMSRVNAKAPGSNEWNAACPSCEPEAQMPLFEIEDAACLLFQIAVGAGKSIDEVLEIEGVGATIAARLSEKEIDRALVGLVRLVAQVAENMQTCPHTIDLEGFLVPA